MLGDYRVEIEDSGSGQVVLSIPAVRLIVMGRTLSEAEELARAALAFRRQDLARPPSGRRHAQPISPTRPTRCRRPALHTRHEACSARVWRHSGATPTTQPLKPTSP